jgi:hypothetical protein
LEELETELASYSTVWDARKRTFDNILNNLEVLRREVEDEKEEQDRKEGMDERRDDEEEEGQVTGAQTSAVKDDRSTREGSRDSGEVDEEAKETLQRSLQPSGKEEAAIVKAEEVNMEEADDNDEVRMVETENQMEVD